MSIDYRTKYGKAILSCCGSENTGIYREIVLKRPVEPDIDVNFDAYKQFYEYRASIDERKRQKAVRTNTVDRLDYIIESIRKNATVNLIEGDLNTRQVLDAACGDGFLASSFLKKGAQVTCLDISERRIAQLKSTLSPELVEKMRFYIGDIQNMCELSDNSFDIVACCEIIEHVPRPCKLLKEIIRVTKPAGRIILSAPNRYALDLLLREIPRDMGLVPRKVQPYFGTDNEYLEEKEIADLSQNLPGCFSEHLREYNSFELVKLIKRYGLNVERLDGTAPPVFPFCKSKGIFRIFSKIYSKIPYFNFYLGQTSVILAQKPV